MWELDIISEYLGRRYNLGDRISSNEFINPYRTTKSGKPCSAWFHNGKLYWKDYGWSHPNGHDIYALVADIEGCSRDEAYERVKEKNIGKNINYKHSRQKKMAIENQTIKYPAIIERMELTRQHESYYETIFVGRSVLDSLQLKGCKSVTKGPKSWFRHTTDNFGFAWNFGPKGRKAYLPFNYYGDNRVSWFHFSIETIEGFEFIDWWADHLIITKSMKDLACLKAAGYNAICVSGEAMTKLLLTKIHLFLMHFKTVYVWSDPDPAGYRMLDSIGKYFRGWKNIQSRYGKDPSEIILNTGSRFWVHNCIDNAKYF